MYEREDVERHDLFGRLHACCAEQHCESHAACTRLPPAHPSTQRVRPHTRTPQAQLVHDFRGSQRSAHPLCAQYSCHASVVVAVEAHLVHLTLPPRVKRPPQTKSLQFARHSRFERAAAATCEKRCRVREVPGGVKHTERQVHCASSTPFTCRWPDTPVPARAVRRTPTHPPRARCP